MLERVVENWLIKTNEHGFFGYELAFCQLLTGEKHHVVHLTRHGPTEKGKDIISIAPDGMPCAFQLKDVRGSKFKLTAWKKELEQIIELIELPINHPAVTSLKRRVYLVINGDLDEEVLAEINLRNQAASSRQLPKLEVITKGQLISRFMTLHTNLWPIQLEQEKELLELYLANGRGCIEKSKLSRLLTSLLPLAPTSIELKKDDLSRCLAGAALFTTYVLSPYAKHGNHVALVEGWVIYLAHLLAIKERYKLEEKYWRNSFDITIIAIQEALKNLWQEMCERGSYVEGEPLSDVPFYRGRMTWILGLNLSTCLVAAFRKQGSNSSPRH